MSGQELLVALQALSDEERQLPVYIQDPEGEWDWVRGLSVGEIAVRHLLPGQDVSMTTFRPIMAIQIG